MRPTMIHLERVLKIDRGRDCGRGEADGEAARKAGISYLF
jgi:hypothetical protein